MEKVRNQKLSDAMKRCHAEGRHPGWSHINLDLTRSSYPEKWFRNVLKTDERFKEFIVSEQLTVSKYFLDFAFLECMVDLEIDGAQHRREEVSSKDKIRDAFLNECGWSIYRIEWKALCENTQKSLDVFAKFLKAKDKNLQTFIKAQERPHVLSGLERRKIIADERMKILRDANIDFSKYGWVQKTANLLKMKPQKINPWMKRYFPELLETMFHRRQ